MVSSSWMYMYIVAQRKKTLGLECTPNKNVNATCKALVLCFMSWNKISQQFSICTKIVFFSNLVHKFVYIHVSERFSFAKIIHPCDRCGITRNWLNSMILTQVHLVLGKIKGNFKMCRFVTQHNSTDVSSWQGACNRHADCRNVHQSCCQRIECSFHYHNIVFENVSVCPTADHV